MTVPREVAEVLLRKLAVRSPTMRLRAARAFFATRWTGDSISFEKSLDEAWKATLAAWWAENYPSPDPSPPPQAPRRSQGLEVRYGLDGVNSRDRAALRDSGFLDLEGP